jgi:hypothetical protein
MGLDQKGQEPTGCPDLMMRAMARTNKMGDDAYLDRLLSYFQSKFHEKIKQFVPIRKKVFYVKNEKKYIYHQRLSLK